MYFTDIEARPDDHADSLPFKLGFLWAIQFPNYSEQQIAEEIHRYRQHFQLLGEELRSDFEKMFREGTGEVVNWSAEERMKYFSGWNAARKLLRELEDTKSISFHRGFEDFAKGARPIPSYEEDLEDGLRKGKRWRAEHRGAANAWKEKYPESLTAAMESVPLGEKDLYEDFETAYVRFGLAMAGSSAGFVAGFHKGAEIQFAASRNDQMGRGTIKGDANP